MLALLNGSPRDVAFDVALARWRAHNAGVPEPAARRALIRLFAFTVWNACGMPAALLSGPRDGDSAGAA